MGKFKDLTGQVFNNWLVLEHKGFNKHGASLWLVECKCYKHTKRIKSIQSLKVNKDCGCRGLETLVGKHFGRWTVLEWIEKDIWKCQCSCSEKTIKNIDGRHLRGNKTHSCGCLTLESCKKYNSYDLTNGYGIGYTTNKNDKFIFDLDDYFKIKDTTWVTSSDGYIIGSSGTYSKKRMHRIIINTPIKDDTIVDHINRDRLDNRKCNLRIANNQENSFNSSKRINNNSGIIGVSWWKRDNNWMAQIKYNYKRIFLGYYDDIEDAIRARLKAELKYFGKEFAPQRHLFKEYGIKEEN